MKHDYRLIFCDLDGTVVGGDDRVSPRTIAAIQAVQQRGCSFVVCTARNRFTIERSLVAPTAIADQIEAHRLAVYSNGAIVGEWRSPTIHARSAMDVDTIETAVEMAVAHGLCPLWFGVDVENDGGQSVWADGRSVLSDAYLERYAHRLQFGDPLRVVSCGTPVSMSARGPRENTERFVAACADLLGERLTVYITHASYGQWNVDLIPRGVTKATGAQTVAAMLGILREQVLAIGDSVNDIELLQWAGLGVCVGDGHPDAVAAADYVTEPFAEDGAAKAIERFLLVPRAT